MHIGAFIRGLVGSEPRVGDVKELELRSGQVVSGLVLESADNEALIQINGAQVRAKLEVPLQPGQRTLLVVQPEQVDGLPVLKPADSMSGSLAPGTLKDIVKSLGLPADKQWALDVVKQLQKDGVPLTRELGEALSKAYASMPQGVSEGKWLQAAATAFQRGLPITPAVLSGLHQVMNGTPVHELLDQLQSQLKAWQESAAQPGGGAQPQQGGAKDALAARVLALLGEGDALLRGAGAEAQRAGAQPPQAGAASTASGAGGADAQRGGMQPTQSGPAAANAAAGTASAALSPQGSAAAASSAAAGQPGAQAALGAPAGGAGGAAGAAAGQQVSGAPAGGAGSAPGAAPSGGQPASQPGAGQPAAQPAGGWLGDLFRWLGVSHERQLARTLAAPQGAASEPPAGEAAAGARAASQGAAAPAAGQPAEAAAARSAAAGAPAPGQAAAPAAQAAAQGAAASQSERPEDAQLAARPAGGEAPQAAQHGAARGAHGGAERPAAAQPLLQSAAQPLGEAPRPGAAGAETLKSALLLLAAADDAPPALRETAQQLVSHITGQQLLLAPERGHSPFSHVAMVIPFYNEQGGQTAAIHIQTRRGQKGELDAQNCRLLFDLQMKQLGDTLIDVSVVDRMVSLQVWNDHPVTAPLMEESRAEIAEALQQSGYKLIALKTQPLPDLSATAGQADGAKQEQPELFPAFVSRPYKGMDMRI